MSLNNFKQRSSKLLFLTKLSLIISTLCLTVISAADPKCTKVTKCASSNYITTDQNQCIFYHTQASSNTTTLNVFEYDKSKCKAGFACQNPTQMQNYTCLQKPSLADLIPGSTCTTGTQCASNECNNGLCAGKPVNGICTNAQGTANHNACNTGLYCAQVDSTTAYSCQPQKIEGNDCKDFFACKNNLVCNYLKCTKAFSLPVGEAADEDLACATRTRYYSEADKKSFCAELKLVNKNATHCNYTYGFKNMNVPKTVETQCTETEDKDSYCPLASDSAEWKEMVNTLSLFMNSNDFINAHATYKDEFGNFDKSLNRKIEPVLQYPKFKGADECLLQLYLGAGFIRVGLFVVAFALLGVFG